MKARITSTDRIVKIKPAMNGFRSVKARVWEGVTEGGVAFTAYITLVHVLKDDDNSEFERELKEHKEPDAATRRAIDARMVL